MVWHTEIGVLDPTTVGFDLPFVVATDDVSVAGEDSYAAKFASTTLVDRVGVVVVQAWRVICQYFLFKRRILKFRIVILPIE